MNPNHPNKQTCYHMSMLDRRLQILIDEERWSRLEDEASRRQVSVSTLVREAIDERYPGHDREVEMLHLHSGPVAEPDVLFTPELILEIQQHLGSVFGTENLHHYIVDVAEATRRHRRRRLP